MEILDQLEHRISQLIDSLSLMQMEIDELTEKNQALKQQAEQESHKFQSLETEVSVLRTEQQKWQDRLRLLLGKIDDVTVNGEVKLDSPKTESSAPATSDHSVNQQNSNNPQNVGGEQQALL